MHLAVTQTVNVSRANRRAELRAATAHVHAELDALTKPLVLTRRRDYGGYLRAMAGPLATLERALEEGGIEALFSDWPARRRRALIAEDLRTLKLEAPCWSVSRTLATCDELFGTLYVLDGSRLGARALLRNVATSDDADVRAATRFLQAQDAGLWRSFLERLETAPLASASLIGSALSAFESFKRAFEAQLATPDSALV